MLQNNVVHINTESQEYQVKQDYRKTTVNK